MLEQSAIAHVAGRAIYENGEKPEKTNEIRLFGLFSILMHFCCLSRKKEEPSYKGSLIFRKTVCFIKLAILTRLMQLLLRIQFDPLRLLQVCLGNLQANLLQ